MAKKKKEIKKDECPWYRKLSKTLFYDVDRKQLSRTALMNFVFFSMAVILFIVQLVAYIGWKITLPTVIFGFVGGLTGGGFLQYSFGKTIPNGKSKPPVIPVAKPSIKKK